MFAFAAVPAPWGLIGQLLLLIIVALLITGFVLNRYDAKQQGRMPKSVELPQSALLVVLSVLIWATAARDTGFATLALLISIGMAFGFLGDLFMANVFRQSNPVLFAMIVFAVGHIMYVLAFREIALHFGLLDLSRYVVALGLTWLLALVLWFFLIRNPKGSAMQYAALVYALFLASMAGVALGLSLQQQAVVPLAIGAILFLVSDALLGARLFGKRTFPYMGDIIWVTYIAAQMLIVSTTPSLL